MAYAQPQDLLNRYDNRQLSQFLNDTGNVVLPENLLIDGILQTALDTAAGMIDSDCFKGQRYLLTDLQSLTGVDLEFLLMLNCDLAFGLLAQRRGFDTSAIPQFQRALEHLVDLRHGEIVFVTPTQQQAIDGNATSEFPSCQVISQLNLARDYAQNFFPVRRDQNTTPADI
jgi:phage gp36-like protein